MVSAVAIASDDIADHLILELGHMPRGTKASKLRNLWKQGKEKGLHEDDLRSHRARVNLKHILFKDEELTPESLELSHHGSSRGTKVVQTLNT